MCAKKSRCCLLACYDHVVSSAPVEYPAALQGVWISTADSGGIRVLVAVQQLSEWFFDVGTATR